MPPNKKRRICGQARVSSQKQKDEATIEDQIKFLKDLFTRLGIFDGTNPSYEFVPYDPDAHTPENPSFFVDEAYNAEEEDRNTALYEMLKRIELGEIDVTATYDMNRIFRTQDEVFRAKIARTFRLAEATIFLNGQERNPADMVSLFEQFQGSASKTLFLQNGQRGKRRKVETQGAPPSGRHKFGWRWDGHSSARRWNEVPRDLSMVRWIGCLSGGIADPNMPAPLAQALAERPFGYSHAEIAELMNRNGFSILPHLRDCRYMKQIDRNPSGRFFESFVRDLLNDRTYAGTMEFMLRKPEEIRPLSPKAITGQRDRFEWKVRPVFSETEWAKIQERHAERSDYARRNVQVDYLLKDIIVCADCGIKLGARQSSKYKRGKLVKDRSTYYLCNRKNSSRNTGRCVNTGCVNARVIEPLVWRRVTQYILDPSQVEALISRDNEYDKKDLARLESALRSEEAKLPPMEAKIDRINGLVVDGVLTSDEALRQKQRIKSELAEIERQIQRIRSLIRQKKKTLSSVIEVDVAALRSQIGDRLDRLSFSERRAVIAQVVSRLSYNRERRLEILFRPIHPKMDR